MKTRELIGTALNRAVARAEGLSVRWDTDEDAFIYFDREEGARREWSPATDWAQGGPIIEREIAKIERFSDALWEATAFTKNAQDIVRDGPTPLIAAMRCYVTSKLGDEINVPEEIR
jgi:hypothetical protein